MAFSPNLGQAFAEIVREYGERPAVFTVEGGVETYRQLDQLSNRIAHLLVQCGLGRGQVVAIYHDKGPVAFATMLACLKTGLIYTNLDPDSPSERIRRILETCSPKAIVNSFAEPSPASHRKQSALSIDVSQPQVKEELARQDPTRPPDLGPVTGADPAYIMFTSGSTGMPKGAVISHANVLGFVFWAQTRFQIVAEDIFSGINPMFFDNSVFDFYAALFSGAALAPIPSLRSLEARGVVELVNQRRCTIWFSVPSLLVYLLTARAVNAGDFSSIRKIVFGGEGFPKTKLKQLYDLFGSRADLENVYGPTECTCICSSHAIVPEDFADMQTFAPLGFLAANFDCEILTEAKQQEGELFLRGPGVGLGYYNDPERTAKSFRQNPRHRRFADIGYCTGDLVRRDTAGRLCFIGRVDFQIKHMGYRIELEEIEAALDAVSDVKECAVIYRKLGDGLGEIVGFAALDGPRAAGELIEEIARIVPPYMLPKRMRILDSLPKSATGKIDRVALQALAGT
jgi:D-alanine--poly(phosphoribitol) ligase subunit 1